MYTCKLVCFLIIQISTFPLADLVLCFTQFLLCVLPLFVHSILFFVLAASLLVAWLTSSLSPSDPHVGASLRCLTYASCLRCNIPGSDVVCSEVQDHFVLRMFIGWGNAKFKCLPEKSFFNICFLSDAVYIDGTRYMVISFVLFKFLIWYLSVRWE